MLRIIITYRDNLLQVTRSDDTQQRSEDNILTQINSSRAEIEDFKKKKIEEIEEFENRKYLR